LLWLLKLFIKDWLFELQQNTLVCAQAFRDDLDHKKSGNEQFFYSNKCAVWAVFSTEQEGKLAEYIITASHIQCGLTRKELMKAGKQFAKELTKWYPNPWDVNG
jgi:hypothetical protein